MIAAGSVILLSAASPCVNAGLNQPWMAGGVDLDRRSRLDRGWEILSGGTFIEGIAMAMDRCSVWVAP